ncbi:hypothetical protein RSEGYP2_7 [Ralstonia phage RsoP1EGY]|uniref:Uncharacterized protein n=1 Tax=Ralstonia phage RsoP1EGY TaxID=2070026 RepID=A0A2R2ZGF4_9CAUD|nr:hypothetical protein HOT00_gp07 [Ralstonia phage RsoP1EGY]AUO78170.1 hypothetical protein RSEGYP2_7 [Ralstonia phage RsoP1EGY]
MCQESAERTAWRVPGGGSAGATRAGPRRGHGGNLPASNFEWGFQIFASEVFPLRGHFRDTISCPTGHTERDPEGTPRGHLRGGLVE